MPHWDREVDLLVFGSGVAGMTAALVGRCEGLDVLLCEKTSQLGGTAATSGGAIWVPASTPAQKAGLADLAAARTYLTAETGNARDDAPRREAFLSTGAEALDYLDTRTEVKFSLNNPYPDYHAENAGGATGGRALSPVPFDADVLGADFALIRAPMPEFMILGGMMVGRSEIPHFLRPWSSWASFKLVFRAVTRYARDRLRTVRGTRLHLGNALVGRYLFSLRRAGAGIAIGTRLVELVREGASVTGAVVECAGKTLRIAARRGVVIATGGFGADKDALARSMGCADIANTLVFEANVGEGLAAARAVGAALDKESGEPAFWMPASSYRRANGSTAVYPHIRDRPKPGLIAVNEAGSRFVNEACSYHDFVMAMFAARMPAAWLVCDRGFIHDYGIGMIPPVWQRLSPFIRRGYLVKGDTLGALARRIGVDPKGLARSVAEHNACAETGTDVAFGKGSTALNRYNGDAANRPNPCLRPIAQAPFFAVKVQPAPIGTSVGLKTDGDARVLDASGAAIPGLYAAGCDMSSIMRGHYPGPGVVLGPSLVFAYRAARHVARAAFAPQRAAA